MTDQDTPLPSRLIREARRTQARLEMLAISGNFEAAISLVKWVKGDLANPWLALAAAGGFASVGVTFMLWHRQGRRAAWLATTDKWWTCLDEMPRMEPFPAVVDRVEKITDSARAALQFMLTYASTRMQRGWRPRS